MTIQYPYKSQDMMLTTMRSMDNGAMRVAIAYHERKSIGEMVDRGDSSPPGRRWVYRTTPEWDEWAETFMNLPGLTPRKWSKDPQWDEFERRHEHLFGTDRAKMHRDYIREFGPKRMILVLDTEEQAMLFKMRWQDET